MIQTSPRAPSAAQQVRGLLASLLMVAAAALAGLALAPRWGTSAVDLLFIPAVLASAVIAGLGPALLSAVLAALAYNYFFTAPHFTFRMTEPNDVVTVLILFAVAVAASQLAAGIRRQATIAHANATRNATIAGFARRLLGCGSEREASDASVDELARIFRCNAILVEGAETPRIAAAAPRPMTLGPNDAAAIALALQTGDRTGRGVSRSVPTEWQFHPVRSAGGVLAAIGLARDDGAPPIAEDQLQLLDSLLDQMALAIERSRLEGEAREFSRVRERDRIRSALLATIGQDLKPSLQLIGKSVRALRRSDSADKGLLGELSSETAKLERYLSDLADLEPDGDQRPVIAGDVSIDLFRREVARASTIIHFTPKEYAVLAELAKHPGRVLSHAHLLRTAWGPAQEQQSEYLRVAIRGLRQKLEAEPGKPQLILNEPAVGYRLNTMTSE